MKNNIENNPTYQILILGLGNLLMADDGIGIFVIEELKKRRWSSAVRILEVGNSVFNFLQEISHTRHVIAIDAVRAGSNPGSVYRLDIEDLVDNLEQDAHGMSLPGVVRLVRSNTGLPETVTIYGVEPEDLSFGGGLTLPVKRTIPKIILAIASEVQGLIKNNKG